MSGLPDGLSEEDFCNRYGSIADPRFADALVEIRGRIAQLHDDGEIKGENDRRSKEE